MSLAGTVPTLPETKSSVSNDTDLAILVIEAQATTPLGPKILYANPSAARQTGYMLPSLVGAPLGLIYDRKDLRILIEKLPRIA
ncbi:MAG: hypothetical protein AAGA96_10680, partial [Verrucomicrobiota bacterium]